MSISTSIFINISIISADYKMDNPSLTPEELRKAAETLKSYFSQDNRFIYRELVGAGSYGSAHRVQYLQRINGLMTVTDFVVKTAHTAGGSDFPVVQLREEWEYLKMMRGGMHIIQLVSFPNDPLTQHNFTGAWIMLEWVANGTIGKFILKAQEHGVQRLPNRLLWRFFLCLIRACCGMAWPRNRQDGLQELEIPPRTDPNNPPPGILHGDFHVGNILLGDFEIGGEHAITPIIKVIDFGFSGTNTDASERALGIEANLWEVGKIMMKLITLDVDCKEAPPSNPVTIDYLGQNVQTRANSILPRFIGAPSPYPWLDEDLGTLIGLCMAVQSEHLPTLQALSVMISYAVVHRDARFYGVAEESDNTIFSLCKQLIMSALV
ncbi:hypothetical protein M434DRAFT_26565 [Hypoxylon sp. CO27-5]|nr:hypothetical protein M434DRAFT_26565 [Hypoxylon sp. CO27-5]